MTFMATTKTNWIPNTWCTFFASVFLDLQTWVEERCKVWERRQRAKSWCQQPSAEHHRERQREAESFKLGSNLPDFRSRDPCTEPAANWTTSLSLFKKRWLLLLLLFTFDAVTIFQGPQLLDLETKITEIFFFWDEPVHKAVGNSCSERITKLLHMCKENKRSISSF